MQDVVYIKIVLLLNRCSGAEVGSVNCWDTRTQVQLLLTRLHATKTEYKESINVKFKYIDTRYERAIIKNNLYIITVTYWTLVGD